MHEQDTLTLTDEQVLHESRLTLAEHLALEANGYKCTTADLWNVLLGVAADQGTIESVCADLVAAPDAETIRTYLNEQLCVEQLPHLETLLNQALVAKLPAALWRRPQDVAIDFHDRPYYGKSTQEAGLWVRGQAKAGTTRFYRIATAYLVVNGLRFTLGLRFVLPEASTVATVQHLLQQVHDLKLKLHRLLLDRGFAGIEVQNYLAEHQIPALIACPIRGKRGGTRALCVGHRSYRTQHTFTNHQTGQARTADVVICRVFTTAKRTKRLRRRASWQVFILIHLDMTPRQVRRVYRRRFGIETSYRCSHKVRGWTTSPNPAYRFLLMALSVLLVNIWVRLRWWFTQRPRRGRRLLDVKAFELARFAKFLRRALEQQYGCVHQITAVVPPRL